MGLITTTENDRSNRRLRDPAARPIPTDRKWVPEQQRARPPILAAMPTERGRTRQKPCRMSVEPGLSRAAAPPSHRYRPALVEVN